MKRVPEKSKPISADELARRADRGENISAYFSNAGRMMPPIRRVNVDFSEPMLTELDTAAKELNISRQAVIKTLVRQALDMHYMAKRRPEKVVKAGRVKASQSNR